MQVLYSGGRFLPSEQIPALACWCAFTLKTRFRAKNTNCFHKCCQMTSKIIKLVTGYCNQ